MRMKQVSVLLFACSAAFTAYAQTGSAADMSVNKLAQPSAAVPSWTGFYIGVHAGAAWESSANWSWVDPNFLLGVPAGVPSPVTLASAGILKNVGGIQGGYNWQFAPAWVAGVEGDISWTSLADHRFVQPVFGSGPATSLQMSANTDWLASVRAKLGYSGWLNNTLLYVTGGGAWANVSYTGTGVFNVPFTDNTSFKTTTTGWVIGTGAEWMATNNILLRAEYLYYDFSANNVSRTAPFSPPFGGPQPVFTWANYNIQVFRIAGSYKF
jgi:outer membrane immunogenic protein